MYTDKWLCMFSYSLAQPSKISDKFDFVPCVPDVISSIFALGSSILMCAHDHSGIAYLRNGNVACMLYHLYVCGSASACCYAWSLCLKFPCVFIIL